MKTVYIWTHTMYIYICIIPINYTYVTLHHIPFHSIALHYITLRYITLHIYIRIYTYMTKKQA